MFKKILYPTDFSNVSKKAMEYCIKLRDAGASEIVVIHTIEWDASIQNIPQNLKNELLKFLEAEPLQQFDNIKSELEDAGFKVKIRLEIGNPIKQILKAETEEDVSVIVIGSHGKSNIKEMLIGSVSENIVRKSRSPVLVIKR